jgi:transposase-like protein
MTTASAARQLEHSTPPTLRRGRHRNRALASYRRTKAVDLAVSGHTYQQIADELGYANRGTVHRIVREALEAQQVQSVELLREVEVRRLDALQVGLWDAAMAGDIDAVNACLKIIQARIKVLGLAELSNKQRPRCQQPQTVILLKDDCRKRGCPDHT